MGCFSVCHSWAQVLTAFVEIVSPAWASGLSGLGVASRIQVCCSGCCCCCFCRCCCVAESSRYPSCFVLAPYFEWNSWVHRSDREDFYELRVMLESVNLTFVNLMHMCDDSCSSAVKKFLYKSNVGQNRLFPGFGDFIIWTVSWANRAVGLDFTMPLFSAGMSRRQGFNWGSLILHRKCFIFGGAKWFLRLK